MLEEKSIFDITLPLPCTPLPQKLTSCFENLQLPDTHTHNTNAHTHTYTHTHKHTHTCAVCKYP